MDGKLSQQENLAKARELMEQWMDCYIDADTTNKNRMGNDFVDILIHKIPDREELRFRMTQLETIEDNIREWIG